MPGTGRGPSRTAKKEFSSEGFRDGLGIVKVTDSLFYGSPAEGRSFFPSRGENATAWTNRLSPSTHNTGDIDHVGTTFPIAASPTADPPRLRPQALPAHAGSLGGPPDS